MDADFVEIVHGSYPWGHPLVKAPGLLRSIEIRDDSGPLMLMLLRELPAERELLVVAYRLYGGQPAWLDEVIVEQLADIGDGWTTRVAEDCIEGHDAQDVPIPFAHGIAPRPHEFDEIDYEGGET
jgi:hypothetical protein